MLRNSHWAFRLIIALYLLAVSVLITACRDSKPLLIGFSGPLTGKYADLGIAGRDAVLLAVEETNSAGGIYGRKIELVAKDDGQDPQQAQKVDQELVDGGVVAIIGHMTTVPCRFREWQWPIDPVWSWSVPPPVAMTLAASMTIFSGSIHPVATWHACFQPMPMAV